MGIARETSGTYLIVFLLKIPEVEEKGEKGHGERKNGFVPLSKIHFLDLKLTKLPPKEIEYLNISIVRKQIKSVI